MLLLRFNNVGHTDAHLHSHFFLFALSCTHTHPHSHKFRNKMFPKRARRKKHSSNWFEKVSPSMSFCWKQCCCKVTAATSQFLSLGGCAPAADFHSEVLLWSQLRFFLFSPSRLFQSKNAPHFRRSATEKPSAVSVNRER